MSSVIVKTEIIVGESAGDDSDDGEGGEINGTVVSCTNSEILKPIKKEILDAEIELKLHENNNNSNNNIACCEIKVETKDEIAAVKSSNELLAELFQVFNSAPPKELLNDEVLLMKKNDDDNNNSNNNNKQHKKHKKKKNKDTQNSSGISSNEEEEEKDMLEKKSKKHKKNKKKKKKKKEHKHKNKDKDDKNITKIKKEKKQEIAEEVEEPNNNRNRKRSAEESLKNEENKSREKRFKNNNKEEEEKEQNKNKKQHNSSSAAASVGRTIYYDEKPFYGNATTNKTTTSTTTKRHNDFYDVYDDDKLSDLTLSDEETETPLNNNNNNFQQKQQQHNNPFANKNRKILNSFYKNETMAKNHHSSERRRTRRSSSRRRSHSRRRRNSRSRSRSRSHNLGIDKRRLLEIARKNAISMFKRGTLPGWSGMTDEVKDKVLLKMRYSGKSVEDLTEFCKKISNGAKLSDLNTSSDDDGDSDIDKYGNPKAFNYQHYHRGGKKIIHPFQLKEREPIVMQIRNARTIDTRKLTDDKTKAVSLQFPVSSGQQHRMTEGPWIPIKTNNNNLPPITTTTGIPPVNSNKLLKTIYNNNRTATTTSTTPSSSTTRNVFEKIISKPDEQQPAFCITTPAVIAATTATLATLPTTTTTTTIKTLKNTQNVIVPLPVPSPITNNNESTNMLKSITSSSAIETDFIPEVPVPSSSTSIAVATPCTVAPVADVSTIITNRLSAMRRLQNNPTDSEALKMMYNSQKEMSCWAASNQIPGQFIGSTGANILSRDELNSGPQAWVRRDQLITTQPLNGGVGMYLLQKMGWRPGEGLGRARNGALEPLLLDIKMDKKGLVAKEDRNNRSNTIQQQQQLQQQQQNKNQQHNQSSSSLSNRQNSRSSYNNNNNNKKHNNNIQECDLNNKHPVCLLNEMAAQRRWTPPMYTVVSEAGPAHSKMFLFSVSINGHTYTPLKGSNTKKEAKLLAAKYCLQELNILR